MKAGSLKAVAAAGFFLSLPGLANALTITIADFESDPLGGVPGAPVVATQGDVTVRSNSDFSANVAPAAEFGNQFAYLTTRDIRTVGDSGTDFTGDTQNEWDVTYMDITFTAPAGGGRLTFFWNILTNEINMGQSDPVLITLDGTELFAGATDGNNGTFPAITSWFPCGGSACTDPYGEVLSWVTPFSYTTMVGAGTHTLRFLVADEGDDEYPTALVVGDITLNVASVPEPGSLALLGAGLAGLGIVRGRKRRAS